MLPFPRAPALPPCVGAAMRKIGEKDDDDTFFEDFAAQWAKEHPDAAPASISPESLERALAKCAQAESDLEHARAAASKIAEKMGRGITGLFKDSQFISRSTGKAWREESYAVGLADGATPTPPVPKSEPEPAPKYSNPHFNPAAAALRNRDLSQPIPVGLDDEESREQAIVAKWNAASVEERARMISTTADRARAAMKKGKSDETK